ncbi:MAG: hypothetical protein IJF63_00790, partial [Alistipes sp.]|nr:hypothetical protein [Alistipes sp.]
KQTTFKSSALHHIFVGAEGFEGRAAGSSSRGYHISGGCKPSNTHYIILATSTLSKQYHTRHKMQSDRPWRVLFGAVAGACTHPQAQNKTASGDCSASWGERGIAYLFGGCEDRIMFMARLTAYAYMVSSRGRA